VEKTAEDKNPERGLVKFIDNPHAPEVFADEVAGFLIFNGNLHITFSSPRVDHSSSPNPVNRVVIGRLVMPVGSAHAFAISVYDFLKQRGFDPSRPPSPEQVQ
jgi:hypothetical protein